MGFVARLRCLPRSQVGEHYSAICKLSCEHRVKLESQFVAVAFAVKLIEGSACKLNPDPNFSISDIAIPIIMQRAAAGLLGQINLMADNRGAKPAA